MNFGNDVAGGRVPVGVDSTRVAPHETRSDIVEDDPCGQLSGVSSAVPVGDRDQGVHEANLFDLDAKYADVVSEDETLAYLHGLD
jgi:maleamate amidohydrolase